MIKQIAIFLIIPQLIVFGTLDRIQKAMEKREYEKALELIAKGYEKEPGNPGINYYHAQLLFDVSYENYDLDSARILTEIALEKFENASSDLKEEIGDDGITLEKVTTLHEQIRDTSFRITLNNLTIETIRQFQQKFQNSIYEEQLNYKADSIEFRSARLLNTESAFTQYKENHPSSVFNAKADSILDDLRFYKLKENGRLNDYLAFHETYPATRHQYEIENFILKASTASHERKKYEDFIQLASSASLKKKAADVIYYSSSTDYGQLHKDADSIQRVISLQETELYPVIQNGLFGFYDKQGQLKINHRYHGIAERCKCELTQDDWVFVNSENDGIVLTKDGQQVLQNVDDYRSISRATGLVKQNDSWYLFHKSGFRILESPVEDAEVIDNRWIKVKIGNKWGLVSFMGYNVAESIYDDIYKIESFWVFEKDGRLAVYTKDLILEEIEDRGVSLEFKFDDIELVDDNVLIGFRDERECLLDSTLNFLIPWGDYEIYPEASGWYLKSAAGYLLYNETEADLMDRYFPYLESNEGWLALMTEKDWILVPKTEGLSPSFSYDSIKLVNKHTVVLVKDNKTSLLFTSGEEIPLREKQIITFQNRPEYISLSEASTTYIFNKNGDEVISGKFENTVFLNDSLIRVQVKGKQGLIHANGDWVLNPVFDAIDEKDGLVLTLIDGKIGCYDPQINELIRTGYEARIERIGEFYLAKKDGKYGVINHVKEEIISFAYDELKVWNDTSYLVRRGNEFQIINTEENPLYDPIESLRLLTSNNHHSIYRFIKNGKYGLLSTQYGELLNAEFTDIFNIGSDEEPLIFADQHLDKAGFHVVSYVNETGDLVLSKAYTREEFDRILCDD